jgi:hypothetical protein
MLLPHSGRKRRGATAVLVAALPWLVVILGGLPASGCKSSGLPRVRVKPSAVSPGAGYGAMNHYEVLTIPSWVRRVAVLPLHADGWADDELAPLDGVFRETLVRAERFEVMPVSRREVEARFGRETFSPGSALPADLLTRLQADFGADAVLFLELTHYAPYQPVAVGVRARLVTAEQGESLWAFDAIFDSAEEGVNLAARKFSTGQRKPPPAEEDTTGVLQSPLRFARYVGTAVFETLPPRRIE